MGLLEPNVASTVAGLVPSNDSYPELVKLLVERYGSKSKITMAYMRALYGLPKPENTHRSLRSFYDSLESYVRGLESLGKASDSYGDLLVCILLDKLPGELRKNLARQFRGVHFNHLDCRIRLRPFSTVQLEPTASIVVVSI